MGLNVESDLWPDRASFLGVFVNRLQTVGMDFSEVESFFDAAVSRTCDRRSTISPHQRINRSKAGRARLSATHFSSQCLFLYEISRQAFLRGKLELADRLYFLNVATTSADLFYEVELPTTTGCEHPLGSVIGRARFETSSSVFFYNSCVIGGSYEGANQRTYPRVEGSLLMYPHSSLIGNVVVRGRVIVGHGVRLIDSGLLEDVVLSVVNGQVRDRPFNERDRVVHGKFISS